MLDGRDTTDVHHRNGHSGVVTKDDFFGPREAIVCYSQRRVKDYYRGNSRWNYGAGTDSFPAGDVFAIQESNGVLRKVVLNLSQQVMSEREGATGWLGPKECNLRGSDGVMRAEVGQAAWSDSTEEGLDIPAEDGDGEKTSNDGADGGGGR